MKTVLSIDAVAEQLTGIGRYAWELAQGLQHDPRISSLRFYRNGRILKSLDRSEIFRGRSRVKRYSGYDRLVASLALKGALFHGPNFFLPDHVSGGIVTVHDLSVFKFPETHPAERVKIFERKFTSSLDRAYHILTDCHHAKQELHEWFGLADEFVTAVPLGVGRNYQPRLVAECAPILQKYGIEQSGFALCVATFEPRKRISTAIAAYELARSRGALPPLLLIGGTGWRNSELGKQIDSATHRGNVMSLGYVDEYDLPFLYASAGLFLFPSIYEGFGLPPLEAMASGVPAIVSNRSCLPEVTQGAAMMIDPDDVDAFAEAILRGLEDDNWRTEAIERGLRVASGYTWDNCIENTVNVYRKVWAENG